MTVTKIPVWKVKSNELLSKHIERMAITMAKLESKYDEIEELAKNVTNGKYRINMLLTNVFQGIFDFDDKVHCAVVDDDSRVKAYYLDEIQEINKGVDTMEEFKDSLPEPIVEITINDKQKQRILNAVLECTQEMDKYYGIRPIVESWEEEVTEIREEITRIISDPEIGAELCGDNEEVFDRDKHRLVINFQGTLWGLEYIRNEDTDVFEEEFKIMEPKKILN